MVRKLTAEQLEGLLGDDSVAIVDTRDDESFEAWRVPGAKQFEFDADEHLEGNGRLAEFREVVGDVEQVVTICAKGISSGNLAYELQGETDEWEVASVDGGMEAWSRLYDRAEIDAGAGATVVQVQRRATGCLGYVVGDPESGEAVVVDPTRDADAFETAATEADLTIAGVIDTHVHADHVSGGRALADDLEVPYYLGERAEERGLEVEFTPLADDEVLEVGGLEVSALSTPGHTSESISLLVDDRALLTADALHVDSTGRTELEFGEGEGEEGARMLYESLHETILEQSDDVVVLPGHVSVEADGTFSNGSPGEPIATTIGEARTEIEVLGLEEDEFVDRLADPGDPPANYEEIIEVNLGRRDLDPGERVELESGPNNCSA